MRRIGLYLLSILLLLPLGAPRARRVHAGEVDTHVSAIRKNAKDSFEQDKREAAIRALGAVATVEAAAALLPLFDDPYVHIHDCVVSAWINMLRSNREGELHTWFTRHALSDRRAPARVGMVTALGLGSGAELADAVASNVKREKDPDVLAAWAIASLRLRGDPELAGVFLPLLAHKDGRVAREAALASARFDAKDAVRPLTKLLRHKDPVARAGAVEALQSLDALPEEALARIVSDDAAAPRIALAESLERRTQLLPVPGQGLSVLAELLAAKDWRVRAGAVQGALRLWTAEILTLLIERLAIEDGRLKDDVHRALVTYTGHDVGADADLWKSWWSANSSGFDAGERPRPDAAGRIRWRKAQAEADSSGTVAFFDVPLYSKRVAFIFDLSGSIGDAAGNGGQTKFEVLTEAFGETVAKLVDGTVFDVFVYRYPSGYPPKPKLTRALGKLQSVGRRSRGKATTWLRKQNTKGWGAFYEPLEAVLDEDVDTVFLLSDGGPSRGRYHRGFRILHEFPRANRFRYLQVNTILLGEKVGKRPRKFMEDLAAATGGRFAWAK